MLGLDLNHASKWGPRSPGGIHFATTDGNAVGNTKNRVILMPNHYCDVIMGAVASQITSLTIVYSTVNSDADQRKHQRSASLALVWGIHRRPVNSPHKWLVTRKMFPFDDVIMRDVTRALQAAMMQDFSSLQPPEFVTKTTADATKLASWLP